MLECRQNRDELMRARNYKNVAMVAHLVNQDGLRILKDVSEIIGSYDVYELHILDPKTILSSVRYANCKFIRLFIVGDDGTVTAVIEAIQKIGFINRVVLCPIPVCGNNYLAEFLIGSNWFCSPKRSWKFQSLTLSSFLKAPQNFLKKSNKTKAMRSKSVKVRRVNALFPALRTSLEINSLIHSYLITNSAVSMDVWRAQIISLEDGEQRNYTFVIKVVIGSDADSLVHNRAVNSKQNSLERFPRRESIAVAALNYHMKLCCEAIIPKKASIQLDSNVNYFKIEHSQIVVSYRVDFPFEISNSIFPC
ncbi:hypothetical protein ACOME3_000358 [Neoechinorhynchus agilis]